MGIGTGQFDQVDADDGGRAALYTPSEASLAFVIPWRSDPHLAVLLRHLRESLAETTCRAQIVVVDDHTGEWPHQCAREIAALLNQTDIPFTLTAPISGYGPGAARNAGLLACNAERVVFIDSDDFPDVAELIAMARLGEQQDAVVVIGGYQVRDDSSRDRDGNYMRQAAVPLRSPEQALLDMPGIWRYVFHRPWLQNHGLEFPILSYAEDLIFLLEMFSLRPTTLLHDKVCYEYLKGNSGSLTSRRIELHQVDTVIETLNAFSGGHQGAIVAVAQTWAVRIWLRGLTQQPVMAMPNYFREVEWPARFPIYILSRVLWLRVHNRLKNPTTARRRD